MIKLKKSLADALGKIPRMRRKSAKDVSETPEIATKKTRHKQSWKSRATASKLERVPAKDTFSKTNDKPNQGSLVVRRSSVNKTNIGDIYTASKNELAEQYLNDLEYVAQVVPGASFIKEANSKHTVKQIKAIIDKIAKREDKYDKLGFKEVVRDEIRARMFMLDADQNYQKIIDAMKKRKYRVASTYVEDANGEIMRDEKGKIRKVQDIDVRFGEKAQVSGYQDVQIRFEKGDMLYELILLPGPNYMFAADKEHAIYEETRRYDILGFTKDIGAEQIVKALKKEIGKVTRKLYDAAENRDRYGASAAQEAVAFTPEQVKTIGGLFSSLKQLFLGKFNSLPPSKKSAREFKNTKTAINLNDIEQNLRALLQAFKPKDAPKTSESV